MSKHPAPRARTVLSSALSALLLAACGPQGTEAPPAEAPAPEATEQGTVLHELKLSNTRSVRFIESAPGDVFVAESGHMDLDAAHLQEAMKTESTQGKTLADVYLALVPGATREDVPAALVAAQGRVAMARHLQEREAARSEGRAALNAPLAEGPSALNTERGPSAASLNDTWDWVGDKNWFQSNFCATTATQSRTCIMDYWYGSYSGVKDNTVYFRAVGLAAGFDSTAYFYTQYKSCGFWPWDGCEWKVNYSTTLQARHYMMVTWDTGPRSRWAGIDQSSDRVYLSTIWSTSSSNPPPAQEPCTVYARAHATTCYNLDGTPSSISNTLCADACAGSYSTASQWATQALGTQTCLGAYAGCCLYYVDQNFNRCGG
ncbi:hypothetical protein LXT21_02940 [Myxococcus sp. K38C18041901]|uniref:hypothetical protein n=1 Tax=Myxococcus guangdongensis TaxID=2906760 RepID=UPI0020A75B09|nr:hypothetical protein [Myxococcus guangdongensis]MCP3057728.1 hypothetical protein [Myxococcus guangdongensis]